MKTKKTIIIGIFLILISHLFFANGVLIIPILKIPIFYFPVDRLTGILGLVLLIIGLYRDKDRDFTNQLKELISFKDSDGISQVFNRVVEIKTAERNVSFILGRLITGFLLILFSISCFETKWDMTFIKFPFQDISLFTVSNSQHVPKNLNIIIAVIGGIFLISGFVKLKKKLAS